MSFLEPSQLADFSKSGAFRVLEAAKALSPIKKQSRWLITAGNDGYLMANVTSNVKNSSPSVSIFYSTSRVHTPECFRKPVVLFISQIASFSRIVVVILASHICYLFYCRTV